LLLFRDGTATNPKSENQLLPNSHGGKQGAVLGHIANTAVSGILSLHVLTIDMKTARVQGTQAA
jgi:hypothetical protein